MSVTTIVGAAAAPGRGAGGGAGREQLVEVPDVAVAVHGERRAGEPAAIDDAGVVQLVREHADARSAEHAQYAEVGGEPGREA